MKLAKSYTLDEEVIKRIKKEAEESKRSASFIINKILENYFRGVKK